VNDTTTETPLTLALLHLAPEAGMVERNKRMVEGAAVRASMHGARMVVTPELAVSGWGFRDLIGIDWIARDQTALFGWAGALAHRIAGHLLLGTPEADQGLFNSMILFGPGRARLGHHRKINVLRVGSESWSAPGDRATSLAVDGLGRLSLFVCADMYSERLVDETAAGGVDLLISSAAWAPGHHGPNGEWERASRVTGRPVLVCNRTGFDVMDFTGARSVAAVAGSVVAAHSSPEAAIALVDWLPRARQLANWRVVSC